MTVAELPIRIDREKIAKFCRKRGIRRMSLFGSVLRDDFERERSDMDVPVELLPTARQAQKLCVRNPFSEIITDWQQRAAFVCARQIGYQTNVE